MLATVVGRGLGRRRLVDHYRQRSRSREHSLRYVCTRVDVQVNRDDTKYMASDEDKKKKEPMDPKLYKHIAILTSSQLMLNLGVSLRPRTCHGFPLAAKFSC